MKAWAAAFALLVLVSGGILYGLQERCPSTTLTSECLKCHKVPTFTIAEKALDETRAYPVETMRVRNGKAYFCFENVITDTERLEAFLDYAESHKIKHAVIEIFSLGGSLFHAWRSIGIIRSFQHRGMIVETNAYGVALSAGFMVFCAGSDGYRKVSEGALLMWHGVTMGGKEVSAFDDPKIVSTLNFFQESANNWLASKSRLTDKDIRERIKDKEFWLTGEQAVKYGFADSLLK